MDKQLRSKVETALMRSWSSDTCVIFEDLYPYYGQCAQTAIVISEQFGGEILKTKGWPRDEENGRHFYNRIDGVRYDFTAQQFSDIPDYTYDVVYEDILSSVGEAMTETNNEQVTALRIAFGRAFNEDERSI